ncbi:hypothetical protein BGZ61DRAFT_135752 [Ilyonectria robusta]|uniref:uncharacterized protein n=1 Tax=Ilyonectria robusta TaxID=1079257 RepID=UPI001E8D45AC|nr:uncharacterized protein BGZ61DRAFT_135752 [Ilyonectria robusta]KAH8735137.1 hypothetical protein BGZ61DRAFT_135752 [Ilyonectria robusta]
MALYLEWSTQSSPSRQGQPMFQVSLLTTPQGSNQPFEWNSVQRLRPTITAPMNLNSTSNSTVCFNKQLVPFGIFLIRRFRLASLLAAEWVGASVGPALLARPDWANRISGKSRASFSKFFIRLLMHDDMPRSSESSCRAGDRLNNLRRNPRRQCV